MIGILCNTKKEGFYSRRLHALFKPLAKERKISVIVFSLSNINIEERTVQGTLVTREGVRPVKTFLPSLIFNFAVQRRRLNIKKMRSLMEVGDIKVVNGVNQYNQWSIMEILSSSKKTKKYVLPYMNYNKEDICFDFTKIGNFLVKPEKRINLNRIIYGRQSDFGFDLYGGYGTKRCHRLDIQGVIHPVMRGRKWLLLKTPGLATYRNRLLIIRANLIKKYDGEWNVLSKTIVPHYEGVYAKLGKKIEKSALNIISCINGFIPDLGVAFIDFVLDRHGTPYFLNFGGWDGKLFSKKHKRSVRISVCKNILEYAEMLSGEEPGVQ